MEIIFQSALMLFDVFGADIIAMDHYDFVIEWLWHHFLSREWVSTVLEEICAVSAHGQCYLSLGRDAAAVAHFYYSLF